MENSENYEQLKQSTKTVLQVITSDDLYYGLFLLVIMIVLLKVIDLLFLPFKKKASMAISFLKACLKVMVIAVIGMRIIALVPGLKDFTSQIFMSSSLIVVVLGFVFQEGLTNIVHGLILSAFRPFHIGDRIMITIDGDKITGYVREINARHTVLQNVMNSAHVIIPNSKMDTCIIDNSYYDGNKTSTMFLDVEITYESNLEKAMYVISQAVEQHPLVSQAREAMKITGPVMVQVRELGSNGIALRAQVITRTVEDNFAACSDIRQHLVRCFEQDPELSFAYPHVEVVQGYLD